MVAAEGNEIMQSTPNLLPYKIKKKTFKIDIKDYMGGNGKYGEGIKQ